VATLVVITEAKHIDGRADSPAVLLGSEKIVILESQISVSPMAPLLNKRLTDELEIYNKSGVFKYRYHFPDSEKQFTVTLACWLSER
jgi:hypothetical protein